MGSLTIALIIFFGEIIITTWCVKSYLDHTPVKKESFEDFFNNTVSKDPHFMAAKKAIEQYSATGGHSVRKPYTKSELYEGLKEKMDQKQIFFKDHIFDSAPIYDKHFFDFSKEFVDLNTFKKVNDMTFIDLNKQAQNEAIQNQHFAEIVYLLEEYVSMIHNYPDQIHTVAETQRKAIFEKFIFLKK